ncbi:MAG: hypothetical protein IT236_08165 [Bacteroidia bacterium]|nr:hypothetical protein [Bacteroidia bacterium]
MKKIIVILLFFAGTLNAQDKLFYANGTVKKGIVVSIGNEFVFFKATDTSEVKGIKKSELVLIEDVRGTLYHISANSNLKTLRPKQEASEIKRNTLGLAPIALFTGRATFIYERLNESGTIGLAFPLSLTFNPYDNDSVVSGTSTGGGVNFFGGVDVNFYVGKNNNAKFFMGPRARYGTDVFFGKTEAYTLQTQFGWRFGNPQGILVQHLSIGFGFVRVISVANVTNINPRQSYAWYSLNYRLGFRW